jgi:flagellar motor switch protein FliN/FliY
MSNAATAAAAEPNEDQLNKAIDELRGVLSDEGGHGAGQGAAASHAAMPSVGGNNIVMSIPVEVQIVLGSTEMPVSDLMALQKGSTVALDRRVGEPVDIVVNGRKIAKGEITVLEHDPSRFGVKLTEIVAAKPAK